MNALRCTLRSAGVLSWQTPVLASFGVRGYALDGLKGYSEKEKVIEDFYFSKEDERLLRKILSKAKAQSEVVDKHAAAGSIVAEKSALKEILHKYNVASEDLDKLLDWKHKSY